MIDFIAKKAGEKIAEIIVLVLLAALAYLIKANEEICKKVVAYISDSPRASMLLIVILLTSLAGFIVALKRKIKKLKTECAILSRKLESYEVKIQSYEDPHRNLVLQEGCSVLFDTEAHRYICPKCFANGYKRSYLDRIEDDEFSREAFTYKCHACGNEIADITMADKMAARQKLRGRSTSYRSSYSNRDRLFAR